MALIVAIVLGDWFWLLPSIIVPIVAGYTVATSLQAPARTGERATAELHPDR